MSSNEFLAFCPTDTGTNLLSQSEYSVATNRSIGNQPGIASSKLVNKAMRQSSFVSAQLAQYIANVTGSDVLDNENSAAFLALLTSALAPGSLISVKTANYSPAINETVLCSTNPLTITLPTAVGVSGRVITIKKTDSSVTNVVTINTTSAQTIDGLASGVVKLFTLNEVFDFVSDGTNWQILYHKSNTGPTNYGAITIGAVTTAPTKASGITVDRLIGYREGANFWGRYEFRESNTTGAAAGSGDYLYTVPATIGTIDSGAVTFSTALPTNTIGGGSVNNAAASGYGVSLVAYDSTHFRAFANTTGSPATYAPISSTLWHLDESGTAYAFWMKIPITGWQP